MNVDKSKGGGLGWGGVWGGGSSDKEPKGTVFPTMAF